jgi:hypothetical protein
MLYGTPNNRPRARARLVKVRILSIVRTAAAGAATVGYHRSLQRPLVRTA